MSSANWRQLLPAGQPGFPWPLSNGRALGKATLRTQSEERVFSPLLKEIL